MVDFAFLGDELLRDLVLQSTAIFALGLLAARCVRLPARAHAVLLLAFLGAIATPLAAGIVGYAGWGILDPPTPASHHVTPLPRENSQVDARSPANPKVTSTAASGTPAAPVAGDMLARNRAIDTPSPTGSPNGVSRFEAAPQQTRVVTFSAVIVLVVLWFAVSVLAIGRLLHGVVASGRLLAAAEPCQVATIETALRVARQRLGLEALPVRVFQSPAVHCPVIWCWSRSPRLVLPTVAVERWSIQAWTPILCHELAHWKRRDHWTALATEFVCCLLPWQPLAWWAKRRLEQASEQACDDWAVAAGHSATDYAETLLSLVAQPGSPLQLAALRRRSGLGSRIRHLLTQRVPRPRPGRSWTFSIVIVTAAITGSVAFCQPANSNKAPASGPAMNGRLARESSTPAPGNLGAGSAGHDASAEDAEPNVLSDQLRRYTAAGRLIGLDGRPIAAASLIWETRHVEKPEDWSVPPTMVAQSTSDAQGRFSLQAELIEKRVQDAELIIRAKGFGLRSYTTILAKLNQPLEIQLEPSYAIEGSIFTPNGEPIKNAKVFLTSMSRYANRKTDGVFDETKEWYFSISHEELNSGHQRSYWPVPAVTDENGQFRFDDVVPRSAIAELMVLAQDFAKTRLGVARPEAPRYPDDRGTLREPKFTLVMENPWVIEGRFVDEKTGAGISGVEIELTPNNYGEGSYSIDHVVARSDQQGRYLLCAGSADMFMLKVRPPQGYPGVSDSLNASTLETLAGKGRQVKYDVKLRPGVILRGRVVAADTGDPVVAADVVYRPERDRKLGKNSDFSSVKTAADGSFEVTGTGGKGFLLVDAPDQGFYRLKVDDKRAPRYYDATYPHGLLEVDVPVEGRREPCVIALERGRELVVRALDPAGKPVKKLRSAFAEQEMDRYFNAKEAHDGLFRINAAQPGRTYRIFLFSEDAMAGIVTELEVPEDGRVIDVRLQPCATIRGRYLFDGGAPAAEVTNFSKFRLDPDNDPAPDGEHLNLPFYDNFVGPGESKRITDSKGEFELKGIVPGVFMYLGLNYQFDNGKLYRAVGVLAPGEGKDLGDLVIHSR